MYFEYGEKETEYLKAKDKRLGEAIERFGHIYRECDSDLFSSVVHHIVGQQISSAAQQTVWRRLTERFGEISPQTLYAAEENELCKCGMSSRKASYILSFAQKVHSGEFDLDCLWQLDDAEVTKRLSSLRGIGVWTAQMLMIFSMRRPDVLSYDDLGIRRGLCELYRHKQLTPAMFERYRKRYSPYGTVASFYIWELSNEAAAKAKKQK